MALSFSSLPSLFSAAQRRLLPTPPPPFFASFTSHSRHRLPALRVAPEPPAESEPKVSAGITDEWGEEEDVAFSEEDEWGTNGSGAEEAEGFDKNGDLKRCLVDSFYGTELGLRVSTETKAEIVELINQLEAANPTPAPTEATELLNGNWILLYTAFSELLPLLAAGTLPLVKLKRISQAIDVSSNTINNSATFTAPLGTLSFCASATFEIRSPSRIQVQFKEGIIQPPELSSSISLPKVDVYGMKVDLTPVERTLKPLEDVVANISRTISGQQPLKVPIPGERTQSWLVTTYLDEDLRISRGDGGLFVLVKEGSPLSAGL